MSSHNNEVTTPQKIIDKNNYMCPKFILEKNMADWSLSCVLICYQKSLLCLFLFFMKK